MVVTTRDIKVGAQDVHRWITVYPPYGDQTSRQEWTDRLADVTTLSTALDLLIDWRRDHGREALEEADVLWIEARIEDRVAVLRFAELSGEFIETTALTGEPIAQACDTSLAEARAAVDVATLETVVTTFRRQYKPASCPPCRSCARRPNSPNCSSSAVPRVGSTSPWSSCDAVGRLS
jgi:methane monooxygenase component A gamma chain